MFTKEPHYEYPSLHGYVVFNDVQSKMKVLATYKKYDKLCAEKMPKHLMIDQTYEPKIKSKVDEPSNILWENLEVTWFQYLWR